MKPEKKPFVILTGPTAVGKSKLSIALAKAIGGEIISADSMQVYRHMDIGSAKIMPDEMDGIPHHLIDCIDPTEDFHVVLFQKLAKKCMEEIWASGKVPILVGGTGFYIQAVLYDIDFTENEEDTTLRMELEELAREKGPQYIHTKLAMVDPESAQLIHANNVKRVIRALEFYEKTGTKISAHNEMEHKKQSPYQFQYFVLTDERATLYANIEKRVDDMMQAGLLAEVRKLKEMGCKKDSVAMQGLGYKEIMAYLDGECSLEEAVYTIKRDTRHFAKRQLTWFRRERDVIWIDKNVFRRDDTEILNYMVIKLEQEKK